MSLGGILSVLGVRCELWPAVRGRCFGTSLAELVSGATRAARLAAEGVWSSCRFRLEEMPFGKGNLELSTRVRFPFSKVVYPTDSEGPFHPLMESEQPAKLWLAE